MKLFCSWYLTIMGLLPYTVQAQDVVSAPIGSMGNRLTFSSAAQAPLACDMRAAAMVQRSWLASMVIPGLGQVYNIHYWKVPCFYLGFVLLGIKIYNEHQDRNSYHRYKLVSDRYKIGDASRPSSLASESYIERRIGECQRARNLFILIASAWYIVNILDAYAGAHDKTATFIDNIPTTPSAVVSMQPAERPIASIDVLSTIPSLFTVSVLSIFGNS